MSPRAKDDYTALGCLKIISRLALFMQEQTLITDRAKILEHHVKNFADNHDF